MVKFKLIHLLIRLKNLWKCRAITFFEPGRFFKSFQRHEKQNLAFRLK